MTGADSPDWDAVRERRDRLSQIPAHPVEVRSALIARDGVDLASTEERRLVHELQSRLPSRSSERIDWSRMRAVREVAYDGEHQASVAARVLHGAAGVDKVFVDVGNQIIGGSVVGLAPLLGPIIKWDHWPWFYAPARALLVAVDGDVVRAGIVPAQPGGPSPRAGSRAAAPSW